MNHINFHSFDLIEREKEKRNSNIEESSSGKSDNTENIKVRRSAYIWKQNTKI